MLVNGEGGLLGALPALVVSTPWWPEVAPVVRAVREAFGVEIVVLRLLTVEDPGSGPIVVTYLAETGHRPPSAAPWTTPLSEEHPLRMGYARPGGPRRDLAWVDAVLAERGQVRTAATQVRSWNLSSVWRIECEERRLWLKGVPPFFAHEGALVEALAGGPVPRVVAHGSGRTLMEEAPGEDLYEATGARVLAMIDRLVDLQVQWRGRSARLLDVGVPDGRLPTLEAPLGAVVRRYASALERWERDVLDELVSAIPRIHAQLEACGLPDTLVHGDFHRGNVRGDGRTLTVLDWGDSFLGNPLFDESAFVGRLPEADVPAARERWRTRWEAAVPGSDPERAAELLAPLAVARGAVVYQGFLDRIEPSEHPYHQEDPLRCLRAAAALLR